MPVARRPLYAVLMKQPDVEPHGGIESAVLVQTEPGQLPIEPLAVLGSGEVSILDPPVGDRAAYPVDQLFDAPLPLGRAIFAVEVLADHDVGGQLGPELRHLAIRLFKQHLPRFPLDDRRPLIPLHGIERTGYVARTENRVDRQPAGTNARTLGGHFDATTHDCGFRLSHNEILPRETGFHPSDNVLLYTT